MTALSDGVRLSIGTLSKFPVAPPRRVDHTVARRAMAMAPLTGLGIGLLIAAPMAVPELSRAAPTLVGMFVILLSALVTGGLHLDGLADTADGFAAAAKGHGTEQVLAVMRRGDVGPMGAAGLVLVLGTQAAAVAALPAAAQADGLQVAALVTTAVVVSRAGLPLLCRAGVPAARNDGLGKVVAGSVPARTLVVALLGTAALAAGLAALAGAPWWIALVQLAAAMTIAEWVQRHARRVLGGVTGDVLGAAVELGLAAALTVPVLVAVLTRAVTT